MISLRPILILSAAAALACAPPAVPGPRGRNVNVITRDELVGSKEYNVYDAISRLRPTYLKSRGQVTLSGMASSTPQVYLDGQHYGEVGLLKSMSLELVTQIRLLNGADATTRYGLNHAAGVIEVTTGYASND